MPVPRKAALALLVGLIGLWFVAREFRASPVARAEALDERARPLAAADEQAVSISLDSGGAARVVAHSTLEAPAVPAADSAASPAVHADERAVMLREKIRRALTTLEATPTLGHAHMVMAYVIATNIERRGLGTTLELSQYVGRKIDLKALHATGDDVLQVDNAIYTFSRGLFPEYTQLCGGLNAGLELNSAQTTDWNEPHNQSNLVARVIDRAYEALELVH